MKKNKTGSRKKKRVSFCQRTKKFLCESEWYWRKEVAVKLKFAIDKIKNEFSFSLCKYQPWSKNINNRLES